MSAVTLRGIGIPRVIATGYSLISCQKMAKSSNITIQTGFDLDDVCFFVCKILSSNIWSFKIQVERTLNLNYKQYLQMRPKQHVRRH